MNTIVCGLTGLLIIQCAVYTFDVMPAKRNARSCTEIDARIGLKVKVQRLSMNLSGEELAGKIGVTYQQLQKYEKGTTRITVTRLLRISDALHVPITYFLDNNPQAPSQLLLDQLTHNPDIWQLINSFNKIPSRTLKQQILSLAKSLAE